MILVMNRPSLPRLGWIFFRRGNFTFGGGTATIAVLDQEMIERRQFVSREEAMLTFGLARLTPGTNLLAYSAALGWLTRGPLGAWVALSAASLPCSLLAIILTMLYDSWLRKPLVATAMQGAIVAAIAVMFATGWTLIRPLRANASAVKILFFSTGACVAALAGVPPIRVLLLAVLLGFAWPAEARAK
jgi:chromate transporter